MLKLNISRNEEMKQTQNTHLHWQRLRLTVCRLFKLLSIDAQVGTAKERKVNVQIAVTVDAEYNSSLVIGRLSLDRIRQ